MKEFSEILRELRSKENLSQEALGNIVHVSRSAIAKYENGLGLPSEEVIEALCKYFKVEKDYLFPKEDVEQLITEKNIIINNQKKRHLIITLSLSLIIIILISLLIIFNVDNRKETKLDDVEFTINLNNNTIFQKQELLFEYDGGYVYQTIEIHEYDFTDTTNLYLIRVHNTYVNGNTAYLNGAKEFSQNEYTESVYIGINFSITQNYRTITSWHQKKPYYCTLTPQLNQTDKILLEDNINLFDGASIKRADDKFIFSYDGRITDWLFDYEYNNILRKCTINNELWNSSWEYEMIDEISKSQSFTIISDYLIESKPGELINFDIITKMNNANMSIEQKKKVSLYT